eukprot:12090569-Alexandrium_andersonii.AAC.1
MSSTREPLPDLTLQQRSAPCCRVMPSFAVAQPTKTAREPCPAPPARPAADRSSDGVQALDICHWVLVRLRG